MGTEITFDLQPQLHLLLVSIFKNWGWWVGAKFLKEWGILKYLNLLKVCHEAQEGAELHIEMKMCEGQYTGFLFSGRWLETQMWMSIIFNSFSLCIISLSIQKLMGKGLYCKSLFKPICLHFNKSETFCKRMALSKTSTLCLCSGVRFTWQI